MFSYSRSFCSKQVSHLSLTKPYRFILHSYFKPNGFIRLVRRFFETTKSFSAFSCTKARICA